MPGGVRIFNANIANIHIFCGISCYLATIYPRLLVENKTLERYIVDAMDALLADTGPRLRRVVSTRRSAILIIQRVPRRCSHVEFALSDSSRVRRGIYVG